MTNRADDTTRVEVRQGLERQLSNWMKQQGDAGAAIDVADDHEKDTKKPAKGEANGEKE